MNGLLLGQIVIDTHGSMRTRDPFSFFLFFFSEKEKRENPIDGQNDRKERRAPQERWLLKTDDVLVSLLDPSFVF